MIRHLDIKNYALIESLEFTPSRKLNTITGETGAGKSIMLGAIGLLLGNRADVKALLHEDQKCIVEGTFDIEPYALKTFFDEQEIDYDDDCIIRREISPSGKSRAFVNDTPVTLDVLKTLGARLVDIHSQHETLRLGASSYQLYLIDVYAEALTLKSNFQEAYKAFLVKNEAYESLLSQAGSLKQEQDYQQFLYEELEKAKLEAGEQERQEEALKLAENAEDIKTKLLENSHLLQESDNAVNVQLQVVLKNLESIERFSKSLGALKTRIDQASIELKDIAHEMEMEEQHIEFDQSGTEEIRERLSVLYQLQQKHQVQTVEELIAIKDELQQKLQRVESLDEDIDVLKAEVAKAKSEMDKHAQVLSKKRASVFDKFKKEISGLVAELGMPYSTIEIQHKIVAPSTEGIDEVVLLFSANKGIKPDPLKSVASGGEFSRLMFAIKYIMARKSSMPTVIFDEIDTGISGEIAIKMVAMMQEMAMHHQVIVITHLPQIAARGHQHYFVYKDEAAPKTVSKIRLLLEHERIEEIAKMIGGDNPSRAALENARELLQ